MFQPFLKTFSTLRAIRLPTGLSPEKEDAFRKQIKKCVAKQAALANDCDDILAVNEKIQQKDNLLLIEHEPAACFDLKQVITERQRPNLNEIWWITSATLRALAACEPNRVIHGGLQPRSLLIDRVGRLKVADFGIAPAYENVCGRDSRHALACDSAFQCGIHAIGCELAWLRHDEIEISHRGWIAPFFAPEILAGGSRLNPTSDQFSLGALLYWLATGVHPLGVELDDPEISAYFVPEAYPLQDERHDWKDAFKRQGDGIAVETDQPMLAWAELIYRLLATEPGDRCSNFAQAAQQAQNFIPGDWSEARQVLGESLELLQQQQYDPFLTTLGHWSENTALPELWRTRLSECLTDVEHSKAEQAALRAVAEQLTEGYTALDAGQLDQARAVTAEVSEKAGENDIVRTKVAELEHACDEHERHIQEKADEIVQANLELAREILAQAEFVEARMILASMLEDPLTSPARAKEIEQLLIEAEQQAARFSRYRDDFELARTEFAAGKLTPAMHRLEQLRSDAELPEPLRDEVLQFATAVEIELRRHEEHLEIITQVNAALERLDVTAAEETLAMLPFDTEDPHLIEQRDRLSEQAQHLRELLEKREAIDELLRQGQAEQALAATEALLGEEVPQVLAEQLRNLAENCRNVLEQLRTAQLGNALESLTLAETAYQTGDLTQCRGLLRVVLPFLEHLEPDARQRAEQLDHAARHLEQAEKSLQTARRRLEHTEFDLAMTALDEIQTDDLPTPVLQRITDLQTDLERARAEYSAQRARQLSQWLSQIAEHLERVEVDQAEQLLGQVELPDELDEELSRRYEQLRRDTVRGRVILETLAQAQTLLRNNDPLEASNKLEQFTNPTETLPAWAHERIEKLRATLTELTEARRQETIKQTQTALAAAAQALAEGDAERARAQLETARSGMELSSDFQQQYEQISESTTQLEHWLPKITAIEELLRNQRPTEACEGARELLKETPIPASLEQRLRKAESHSRAIIVEHRTALSTQLQKLATELDQRGTRAKSFVRHLDSINADPIATQTHRDAAEQLRQRYDKLPKPRKALILVAAATVVIAAVGSAGWYFLHGTPENNRLTQQPEQISRTPRGLITQTLTRVRQGYNQAVAALPPTQAPGNWRLYFDPPDAYETTLYAQADSETPLALVDGLTQTMLVDLQFDPSWLDLLTSSTAAAASESNPEPAPTTTPVTAPPEWPIAIAAQTITAPNARQLADVLGAVVVRNVLDSADPPLSVLVDLLAELEIGPRTEHDTLGITLHPTAGAATVTADFTLESAAGQWQPVQDNADQLRNLLAELIRNVLDRIDTATNEIQRAYQAGELNTARRAYEQIRPLEPVFDTASLADSAARLRTVWAALPPTWKTPNGYQPSPQMAPGLDYPRSLTKDGRTFLLVNVPPADPIWDEIAAADRTNPITAEQAGYRLAHQAQSPPATRPWYIFYIETTEMDELVNRDAQAFSRRLQRDLPSVEQWLLAAIKLRGQTEATNFIGGKWDWCNGDDQPWVCGGCDEIHRTILPWPQNSNHMTELWSWLNHPLVSQPRDWGDNLAGIRTVVQSDR